jgi:hypothetical protein
VLASLALFNSASAQSVESVLEFVIAADEWFGSDYIDRPVSPAEYVFIGTEPLRVRIAIDNPHGVAEDVVLGSNAQERFRVTTAFRNGAPIAVRLVLDGAAWKTFPDGRYVVETSGVRLDRDETVELFGILEGADAPGVYEVNLEPGIADGKGRRIPGRVARFSFERRVLAGDERLELLRREAYRYWSRGQANESRAAIAQLLELHPNSIVAQNILELLAKDAGDTGAAQAAAARRQQILADGLDTKLRRTGIQ